MAEARTKRNNLVLGAASNRPPLLCDVSADEDSNECERHVRDQSVARPMANIVWADLITSRQRPHC